MDGWLALNGLVSPRFGVWFGAAAAIIGVAWWCTFRTRQLAIPLIVSLCTALATALAIGGEHWCLPARCDYLDTTSPFIRANLIVGWRWLADHVQSATVAYTGINLPYPLTGEHLTNRVVYANIDGHRRWRFHDYDRAYRAGLFTPSPALAESSGELTPISQRPGSGEAARPRYERMEGFRDGWIRNLAELGVTHLFVSALSAYEHDYVWHNEEGFPIEDEWAKNAPQTFQLLYENPQVRIYSVRLRSREQG
jgi:hypothetical protein